MTAYSRVIEAPDPAISGTTLTVSEDDGGKFPDPPLVALVWRGEQLPTPTTSEELEVSVIDGDVLTFERGDSPIAIEAGMMIGVIETVPRIKLGEMIRLEIFYTDPEEPYTLRLQDPSGAVSTATSAAGTDDDGHPVYFAEVLGNVSGRWTYRWEVGPDKAATADSGFFVQFTGTQ